MNTSTTKLAADMVAQQIAQYDHEIKGLDDQIRHFEARKEAVLMMRKALLPLISGAKLEGAGEAVINVAAMPPNALSTLGSNGAATKATPTGFADAVRSVLRDYPRGVAPSDVAEQMKARGTASIYTGKTPFSVRVGNELHRLLKAGEVGRHSGRYYLKPQEQHQ
jgi:hypothetical protein